MGTPDFAVPSLERLAESGHDLTAVVTRPDRPRGRGRKPAPPPVKAVAQRLDVPILQPESLRDPDFLTALRKLRVDLFVVVAFAILPKAVLGIPKRGSVNLHPSLLPKYRGAAPINWAVIRGERETGVTLFLLKPKVDAGDILLQRRAPIGPDETAGELHDRLSALGAEALLETVDGLARGDVTPAPQSEEGVTAAPKLSREDGRVDWGADAGTIRNLIRGTNPFPGAFTAWKGGELKVHRAAVTAGSGAPGEVILADSKEGLVVAAGSGALALLEVQPAGKRRMSGAELVRGYRAAAGDRMGEV